MKTLHIETQIIDSEEAASMLCTILELAKEAGYELVRDHWGVSAYDEYTIDEAIARFARPKSIEGDLPF